LQLCPTSLSCDVAIVGTGAGAGITAELLTAAGLSVVLIEEGPLKSSADFRQRESDAYPTLYQESANRKTADKGVSHPAGPLCGRLDHGQLDQFLPHAVGHAGLLARALRPDGDDR
jgi:choline dehydrogenase-like flavoprotein